MPRHLLLLLLLHLSVATSQLPAQSLLPHIGLGSLPADSTPICPIPWYLGNYDQSGYTVGDTVHDFTLYDLAGTPWTLSTALATGKPVLLVAGSYTCPVFRNKIATINQVATQYAGQIETVVVYGPEAHPTDTSPYFGYINVTTANQNTGILYAQPQTYGARKAIAADLLAATTLSAPLLIDGPCNAHWLHYGPAPNNAYLIAPNGTVAAKHPWFHRYPDDIFCDIDSLLGNPGPCAGGAQNGSFSIQVLSTDTAYGTPGATLSIDVDIVNSSNADVLVYMRRLQNNLAPGWSSSMCADVCYTTSTDSVVLLVPAQTTQAFHFYFYTGPTPGISHARMGWRNVNFPNNQFARDFWGVTTAVSNEAPIPASKLLLFPNPAQDRLSISGVDGAGRIVIHDLQGRMVCATTASQEISLEGLPPGMWGLEVWDQDGNVHRGRFLKQ